MHIVPPNSFYATRFTARFRRSANQVEILSVAVLGCMIEDVGLVAKLIERRVTPAIAQVTTTIFSRHGSAGFACSRLITTVFQIAIPLVSSL